MWRRRILRSTAWLGAASAIMALSCSTSTPVDINFGKEAGTGFDAPARELRGSGGSGGESGEDGAAGVGGAGGAGGVAGTGGATGDDAGTAVDAGTASLNNQNQYSNRPPRSGAA